MIEGIEELASELETVTALKSYIPDGSDIEVDIAGSQQHTVSGIPEVPNSVGKGVGAEPLRLTLDHTNRRCAIRPRRDISGSHIQTVRVGSRSTPVGCACIGDAVEVV